MSGFSPAFDRLGSALGAVVLQQQETLAEFLPREDWSADLAERTYTSGGVTVRVWELRSYAGREKTWLWGWASPHLRADHRAAGPTLSVKEMGEPLRGPELTPPEDDDRSAEAPDRDGG